MTDQYWSASEKAVTDYDEARSTVAHQALKLFDEYGRDRALNMYFGAIDALTFAVLCLNSRDDGKPVIRLAIDNTKPGA